MSSPCGCTGKNCGCNPEDQEPEGKLEGKQNIFLNLISSHNIRGLTADFSTSGNIVVLSFSIKKINRPYLKKRLSLFLISVFNTFFKPLIGIFKILGTLLK